jgi:hypothetical protein
VHGDAEYGGSLQRGSDASQVDVEKWIQGTFSLKYW